MSGYRVQAVITRTVHGRTRKDGSRSGGQITSAVPSFVLETNVLGLVDQVHAHLVAFNMLRELVGPDAQISLTVANLADWS